MSDVTSELKTFENYPGGRAAAVSEAKLDREQDRLVSGFYYRNGKGCSIGCFAKTEDNPHEVWAEMMGTPLWFPRLVDRIFEILPADERVDWHVDVIEAIPEGVDVSSVGPAHAERCLRRCVGYIGGGDEGWRVRCRNVVADSADILAGGRWLTDAEAARAARAAWAVEAAWAARAARSVWTVEAAWTARAAWAARAARAVEAVWAARAAWAAEAAEVAWDAEICAQRDDLLDLLSMRLKDCAPPSTRWRPE